MYANCLLIRYNIIMKLMYNSLGKHIKAQWWYLFTDKLGVGGAKTLCTQSMDYRVTCLVVKTNKRTMI